jgi:nucleotide-binding universal stress UspA family protein
MLPIHTILFPTDFSEQAQQAFSLASSLARDCGARLVVLHVAAPPVSHEKLEADRNPGEYYGVLWDALRQLRAPEDNVPVEHRLEEGDPAAEVLSVAKETKAGLIVMGTHGRTGLSRLLMGSVAEHVMRQAPCPVLTVKTPLSETATKPLPHLSPMV